MKEFQSVVRENARWNETPFLYLTVWELINTIEVLECVWRIKRESGGYAMKQQKEKVEFRYYEVPQGLPLIALTGEKWEIPYGSDGMHFHNHLEIGYCHYGEGTIYFGKEEEPYHDGTMTVIPKDYIHRTHGSSGEIQKWEFLFIDADAFLTSVYGEQPHYAQGLLRRLNNNKMLLDTAEKPEIYTVFSMILKEMEQQGEFYKENVKSLLLVLLMDIIRLNKQEEIVNNQAVNEENFESIVEILKYINQNYAEELRIGDLAKMANMSETHFRRVFTEYIKVTPVEYINLVRIEKACELMKTQDIKMEDIAVKVGFPVFTTFSRNFKRITGYSPLQWKKMIKKEDNVLLDYKVSVLKGW